MLCGRIAAYRPQPRVSSGASSAVDNATEYELDLIVISEIHDVQVVYVRKANGEHCFPILIGLFEAISLDRHLKRREWPRPLTRDAAASILTTLGGELEHVLVDRWVDTYWCARLCIRQLGRRLTVDIRPSDAFVLALLLKRPIFFANEIIQKYANA